MNFEMADASKPEEIALAVQQAFISSFRSFLSDIKKEVGNPGLTWSQLDYILAEWSKKKPTIIIQKKVQ